MENDNGYTINIRLLGQSRELLDGYPGMTMHGSKALVRRHIGPEMSIGDLFRDLAETYSRMGPVADGSHQVMVVMDGKLIGAHEYDETLLSGHTELLVMELYAGG